MNYAKENQDASETVIPSSYKDIVAASTTFCIYDNSLDDLESFEIVKNHTIFFTLTHHLIEVHKGNVLQMVHYPIDITVRKIDVYFIEECGIRCVFLLLADKKCHLLTYKNLKFCYEWDDVETIKVLTEENGRRKLLFVDAFNDVTEITYEKLLCFLGIPEAPPREKGEEQAALAIRLTYQKGIEHLKALKMEREAKQAFLKKKLEEIKGFLVGNHVLHSEHLSDIFQQNDEMHCDFKSSIDEMENPLSLISVKHRVVHDKWVICFFIMNNSESYLVCNPELFLSLLGGAKDISYSSKFMKSVQRRQRRSTGDASSSSDGEVTVEHMDPHVLKPKKRAFILGVITLPPPLYGPVVSCSGVILYNVRMSDADGSPVKSFQLSFQKVEIDVTNLPSYTAVFNQAENSRGISSSSLALIAASREVKIKIATKVSFLDNFLESASHICSISRICDVSHLFCFKPTSISHPLHYAAFFLKEIDLHTLDVKLLTRDVSQALVLIHSLVNVLPKDATIEYVEDELLSDCVTREKLDEFCASAVTAVRGIRQEVNKLCLKSEGSEDKDCLKKAPLKDECQTLDKYRLSRKKDDYQVNLNLYRSLRSDAMMLHHSLDDLYVKNASYAEK